MSEWDGYILEDYRFEFDVGSHVLDVGCGAGKQMADLRAGGSHVFGVDVEQAALTICRKNRLNVGLGKAEELPFADSTFDGVLCKVALSYTDDRRTINEFARVLKPGAVAYIITHGAGYYLTYLLKKPSLETKFYGFRSLINTLFFSISGQRLPGFLGDTIYQSEARLADLYAASGFEILQSDSTRGPFGKSVFIYQKIRRKLN